MIRRLVPYGANVAIVIEKPIMELLAIDIDTPLEITTDGKNLIISPVENAGRSAKLKNSLAKINQKHNRTLEKPAH